MKVLVTGGAGYIGSHVVKALGDEGHEVLTLDNLSTGNPQALDRNVHFTQGDVNDRPKLWTLLQNIDCVYHLAARVSVPESILFPREYNTVNVGGTVSLMESIRDVGVRRVIFISSGAIYGQNAEQPLHEQLVPHPACCAGHVDRQRSAAVQTRRGGMRLSQQIAPCGLGFLGGNCAP